MNFCYGIEEPEGPVVLNDGSFLVVEMDPLKGCITHISKDGKKKKIIASTGRPNGLAIDSNGYIWAAESGNASLIRVTMDGKVETFLKDCNGEEFLFPNDLAFGPDGKLYLTDSGISPSDFVINGKIRDDFKQIKYDGRIYVIDKDNKHIEKLDGGLKFTNGLAFGPSNDLFVNETITGNVYKYAWDGEKILGKKEYYGNVIKEEEFEGLRGPDGMKFDKNGLLYVTVYGQGDVTILGEDGKVFNRIKTEGSKPTNCVFGLEGTKSLFVTEVEKNALECFSVDIDGLPLFVP